MVATYNFGSVYVKKVMKPLAFIFEQPSYLVVWYNLILGQKNILIMSYLPFA